MSRLRKTQQQIKQESPWDWLLQQSERDRRERTGYADACELDRLGKYAEADEALRLAGVAEAVIADRRRHIGWRLREGMGAID